jgi:DNA polymerase I
MPKTFYIIDGHAQIYRAYFAPFRDLTSSTGEPTKATFVFTQMLINLIERQKPEHLAMVIDQGGDEAVFRKEIYPEYKANRNARPDDFEPQERRILQIMRDAGIPIFGMNGFEADDLIATMTKRLEGKGYDVIIVSKDKDLRQLLDEHTRLYDVHADVFMDVGRMQEELGYGPAQAVEVQTLTGDATDNVPGIPGIGEKTAAKLINKYGNVSGVLEHISDLTPKMRENFEKHKDVLPMSRQLVTLRTDVDFDFDPDACCFNGINAEAVKSHLEALGFNSLLKRLGIDPEQAAAPVKKKEKFEESLFGAPAGTVEAVPAGTGQACDYRLVDAEEKFVEFVAELKKQKRFAFDTETDALGAMCSNVIGMSFSWAHGTGFYVPVRGPEGSKFLTVDRVLGELRPILENPKIGKFGHNIKYDLLVMRQNNVAVKGVILDSMIAAFVLDAGRMRYGIDDLAKELLNFKKVATIELIGKGKNQLSMDRVDLEKVARYAAEDADIALRLAEMFEQKLEDLPALKKLAEDLETPLIDVLVEMERNGVSVDPAVLKEQSLAMGERIAELHKRVMTEAGVEFNPDSPKQLGDVLFNKLKLRVVKKNKTGPSTDVEVLEKLAAEHPVPKLILEYRSLMKLKNTYLDNLTDYVNPATKRIHASFNQTGAATGRLSCSDPNLQNIPIRTDEGRRIRLAFVPGSSQNVLLTADYAQIELRVLAHFTREEALVRAFEADEDVHRTVAAEVFSVKPEEVTREQRNQAKIVNFGIIYGVSAYGLARRIDGMSVQAAGELIASYNKRFPTIPRFLQKCVMEAQEHGYVETMLGRRRPIPDISSGVLAIRNGAERMAINSVVQGSAADLIKIAMLNVYRRLMRENRPSKILIQVHDELVFETPADRVEEEAAIVREEMVNAGKQLGLSVPLKVEVGWGKNWQEVK